ncbi:hypothetical protein HNP86_001777 [Methanococcus maripaludis]|uniref:Uncharacterized protein n=1 Tax=Methanococcus maripaludis TaxID=39152 RepID=A0A7J9NVB7_METMI|nr:hypothetical protein [Methanococcus maripaludis]MBA2851618.1 hypothetical protein [Methanococcus maripaludis]
MLASTDDMPYVVIHDILVRAGERNAFICPVELYEGVKHRKYNVTGHALSYTKQRTSPVYRINDLPYMLMGKEGGVDCVLTDGEHELFIRDSYMYGYNDINFDLFNEYIVQGGIVYWIDDSFNVRQLAIVDQNDFIKTLTKSHGYKRVNPYPEWLKKESL